MNFNYVVIRQYLLKYYINYTITILSTPQIENISYDTINCYFKYYSNPMSDWAQKSYFFLENRKQGTENR